MNLKELARATAAKTGATISDTERTLTVAFEQLGDALVNVEKVTIHEFGIFEPTAKPASVGRNPATGERVNIGPKTAVKFKIAKALKGRLAS